MNTSRRTFLNQIGLASAGIGLSNLLPAPFFAQQAAQKFTFEISLAEFSFASELFTGKMTNMQFPERAKKLFDITVLEYVSGFFSDKHKDYKYLGELKQRCDDLGMKNHLIMVDGENITALDKNVRQKAVESHYPWVDAAKYLGCTSIRVNLGDASAAMTGKGEEGSPEDVAKAAVEGYGKLCEYGEKAGVNIIIENHFGYSTNPDWLVGIIKQVHSNRKGFLPDFGNFCAERTKPEGTDLKSLMDTKCIKEYDKYKGVKKMMPFVKGISAKTHRFSETGDDLDTDFIKMFKIIKKSGWTGGYVGIEYEGGLLRDFGGKMDYLSNDDGVRATKVLLEKVLAALRD